MNDKTKELIAIGASVAAHCQPCLKYHYAKARELGIEVTDINAAVDVGHQVAKGAGKAMRDFQGALTSNASEASEGACCGSQADGSSGKCC